MINEKMAEDFRALGLKKDDVVLMHSSLSSLGFVEGGADTVIDTLLSVLSEGTLLMPALSYQFCRPETPYFSAKDTPSCIGAIPEAFRKREGTLRSIHPSHSVCGVGKYAEEILREHIKDSTPVGPSSAFALLPKYGGKVLMLGCGIGPNTSIHGVEELVTPVYLYRDGEFPFTLVDENGTESVKNYKFHGFHCFPDKNYIQRYARLKNLMDIPSGRVLDAECHLIDAKTMWRVGEEALKENPFYFVEVVDR